MNNTKATLLQQRSKNNIENAAITQKIIEYNQDIAEKKYERGIFFFRDFHAWQIDTLTYLR